MSEGPEKIWLGHQISEKFDIDCWSVSAEPAEGATWVDVAEYIRTDIAEAAKTAAYEAGIREGMERATQFVSQGWCVPPNTHKIFDPDLATGIQETIRAAIPKVTE
jgi:hypothetical protein